MTSTDYQEWFEYIVQNIGLKELWMSSGYDELQKFICQEADEACEKAVLERTKEILFCCRYLSYLVSCFEKDEPATKEDNLKSKVAVRESTSIPLQRLLDELHQLAKLVANTKKGALKNPGKLSLETWRLLEISGKELDEAESRCVQDPRYEKLEEIQWENLAAATKGLEDMDSEQDINGEDDD